MYPAEFYLLVLTATTASISFYQREDPALDREGSLSVSCLAPSEARLTLPQPYLSAP